VSTYRSHGKTDERSALPRATLHKRPETPPLIGTVPMLEGFGIVATPNGPRVGQSGSAKTGNATTAKQCSRLSSARAAIARGFAALNARSLRIVSVEALDNHEDVYCITVPGEEAFSLANGAVVHNCSHAADAFRYLSMTLDTMIRPATQVYEPDEDWIV
jgi:hypothetical protein